MLPVAIVLNKMLLKKVAVAVLQAAAEAIIAASINGKGKRK